MSSILRTVWTQLLPVLIILLPSAAVTTDLLKRRPPTPVSLMVVSVALPLFTNVPDELTPAASKITLLRLKLSLGKILLVPTCPFVPPALPEFNGFTNKSPVY